MKKGIKIAIGLTVAAILLLYVFIIASIFFSSKESSASYGKDAVAVISLSGVIADSSGDSDPFGSVVGITPSFVRGELGKALDDPFVKAVVLKVNSPGGSAAASQEIAAEIKRFKKEKPVVVLVGDMAASGGYYVLAPCDSIVAKQGSLVGSIGVISQFTDLSGLYEKLGIKVQTVKSGAHKDMGARALTQKELAKWQALSDEIYEEFIKEVAEGRKLEISEVRSLATGELFTGSQAKELKLIDHVGDYQKAIDVAAELAEIEDPVIIEHEGPSLFDALFGLSAADLDRFIKAKVFGVEYAVLDSLKEGAATPKYQLIR